MPSPIVPSGAGSRIVATSARFEASIAAEETRALVEMTSTYRKVIDRLGGDIQGVEDAIASRIAQGKPVPVSWLHKQARYRTLVLNARDEFFEYGQHLGDLLDPSQARVVRLAQRSAEAVLEASLPGVQSLVGAFHSLPENAIRQLRSTFQTGSPLRELLDGFGQWGSSVVEDALTYGLATGMSPEQITKSIRSGLDMAQTRAATIARTELYRSYRESNRATYRANDHLVDAWIWNAHLGSKSCAACLAMHGTEHPLDEPMGSHPNCRCTQLPKTKSWEDLGFPGIPETGISGADVGDADAWLRNADEATQRRAFGNRKLWQGWKDGKLKLPDVVRTVSSPDWGVTRTIAGSAQAQRNAASRVQRGYRARKAAERASAAQGELEARVARVPKGYEPVAHILENGVRTPQDAVQLGSAIRTQAEKVANKVVTEITDLRSKISKLALEMEKASGTDRFFPLFDEMKLLKDKYYQLSNGGYVERIRKAYLDELRRIRPTYGTSTKKLVGYTRAERKALLKLEEQAGYFPQEWWDDLSNLEVYAKYVQRGHFYEAPGQSFVEIFLSGPNDQATAIHEISHAAEFLRPKIRELEHAFYQSRTAGDAVQLFPWSTARKPERYKIDKFHDMYMGRFYGEGPEQYWEIFTMGTESLFADVPRHTMDDEMKDFILGILGGV